MATSFNDQDEFSLLPGSPPASPPDDHSADTSEVDDQISDVPRLRSIHVTAGYREGVSSSKNEKIQQGFDEGYALGAEIGYQVGWILGVLEGAKAGQLLERAREELDVKHLFSPQYLQEDGLWRWHVDTDENQNATTASDGPGSEETILFRHIAVSHPLVRKWVTAIEDLARKEMVDLRMFQSRGES
jgi:hypothetical protein